MCKTRVTTRVSFQIHYQTGAVHRIRFKTNLTKLGKNKTDLKPAGATDKTPTMSGIVCVSVSVHVLKHSLNRIKPLISH